MPTKATTSPFRTVSVMSLSTSASASGYRKDTPTNSMVRAKPGSAGTPGRSTIAGGISITSKTRSTDAVVCWTVLKIRESWRTGA